MPVNHWDKRMIGTSRETWGPYIYSGLFSLSECVMHDIHVICDSRFAMHMSFAFHDVLRDLR
jgi:hypothetical protein